MSDDRESEIVCIDELAPLVFIDASDLKVIACWTAACTILAAAIFVWGLFLV